MYPSIIMQVMEWSGRGSMKEFAKELIEEVAGIPNFRPVGYKPVTIQGHPGFVFCSENVISIEGEKIKERMIAYIFAYRYRFYILIGVLGCIDAKKNLKIEMEKYEPMFKQAVNSIVVYDK